MVHPPPLGAVRQWSFLSPLHSLTPRDGVLRLLGVSPDSGVSEDAQEQQRPHPLPVTREHIYLYDTNKSGYGPKQR